MISVRSAVVNTQSFGLAFTYNSINLENLRSRSHWPL